MASTMTRHNLGTTLYAPLRVALLKTKVEISCSNTTSLPRSSANLETSALLKSGAISTGYWKWCSSKRLVKCC